MKKVAVVTALVSLACGLLLATTLPAVPSATDKTQIEALEKRIAAAVAAKDADGIMANYIKGDRLLVFDVIPPRQYSGSEAYLKDWQGVLAGCADSPKMEISDLAIETAGALAYSHSIQHFACTDPKSNKVDMTLRTTDVYRKVHGNWLIVHEHYSVPVDLASAKADLASKP